MILVSFLDTPYISNITFEPSRIVKEKSVVKMTCNVDANPDPNVTWIKNDISTIVQRKRIYNIQSTSCTNTSNYTCIASNKLQKFVSKTAKLDVTCKFYYLFHCLIAKKEQ